MRVKLKCQHYSIMRGIGILYFHFIFCTFVINYLFIFEQYTEGNRVILGFYFYLSCLSSFVHIVGAIFRAHDLMGQTIGSNHEGKIEISNYLDLFFSKAYNINN